LAATLVIIPCGKSGAYAIPDSVTSIGKGAFAGCYRLTSITIPGSVTRIGDSAFNGCTGMTSITIPSSVTSMEAGVFSHCNGLTRITILGSFTIMGNWSFFQCYRLTSITIPGSVTSIGSSAFSGCTALTSITIPSSVSSIGDSAFRLCSRLTMAKFLGNAPTMGTSVFHSAALGFTINYIKGKTGFTSPSWLGYPCFRITPPPEIVVEQPLGSSLVDGMTIKRLGTVVVGQSESVKKFTIKNTGGKNLTGLAVSVDGTNAGDFLITPSAKTTLLPGETTTFKVTFKPTAAGKRSAAIHIQNNDTDENTFDIKLTGLGAAP
jgi:hypothetical protein